eukprot:12229527-Alexandrium_andersonii.AAC.1
MDDTGPSAAEPRGGCGGGSNNRSVAEATAIAAQQKGDQADLRNDSEGARLKSQWLRGRTSSSDTQRGRQARRDPWSLAQRYSAQTAP